MEVVVLGASLLGVTSAYFLRNKGHEVTAIDHQAARAETRERDTLACRTFPSGFQTRSLTTAKMRLPPYDAVSPAVYMTSTSPFDTTAEAAKMLSAESERYVYGCKQFDHTQQLGFSLGLGLPQA